MRLVAITDISGSITSQQRYLPFGQVRTDVPSPNPQFPITDLGYTGQRQLDGGMGGLMDYHARFYDPYINHFTQPDTITPGGPQGLNRFAYANNNPINLIDPSGHAPCVGDNWDDGPNCLKNPNSTLSIVVANTKYQNQVKDKIKKVIQDGEDGLIWRSVPSAFGLDFGINVQYGAIFEFSGTPFEGQLLYNWRSNQFSFLEGSGTGGYAGIPTFLSGSGYVGFMTVYGASDNNFVAGHNHYGGGTISIEKFGVNKVLGVSETMNNGLLEPFIDPVSKIPVTFRQTNVFAGPTLIPGLVIGVFAGESYSILKELK